MSQLVLEQILRQLEALEVDELQQLHQTIQTRLADQDEAARRAAFRQALLDAGLVKQIKRSLGEPLVDRRLIEVKGKPVSETIIEERR